MYSNINSVRKLLLGVQLSSSSVLLLLLLHQILFNNNYNCCYCSAQQLQQRQQLRQQQQQQHQRQLFGGGSSNAIAIHATDVGIKKNHDNNNNLPLKSSISDLEKELSLIQNTNINNQKKKNVVVVHIGPHKTGTTSIQSTARRSLNELYSDGYEVPGDWNGHGSVNMMGLTNCFLPHYNYTFSHNTTTTNNNNNDNNNHDRKQKHRQLYDYTCNENILEDIRQIAIRQSNMFLSAESFSFSILNMDRIYELLQPWTNVKIIIYYRRFIDWLYSQWNQNFKEHHPKDRPSFVSWISDVHNIDKITNNNYVTACVPRWKNKFNIINNHDDDTSDANSNSNNGNILELYNMHNLPNHWGIIETFFCDGIPNAVNTCNNLRMNGMNEPHSNPSRPLVYQNLAYSGQLKYIELQTKYTLNELTQLVHEYNEYKLQLTKNDFNNTYRICPADDVLDKLLNITLQTEEMYFPQYYNQQGKDEILTEFHEQKYTKLCHIDTNTLLEYDIQWQQFFISLI